MVMALGGRGGGLAWVQARHGSMRPEAPAGGIMRGVATG